MVSSDTFPYPPGMLEQQQQAGTLSPRTYGSIQAELEMRLANSHINNVQRWRLSPSPPTVDAQAHLYNHRLAERGRGRCVSFSPSWLMLTGSVIRIIFAGPSFLHYGVLGWGSA